MKNIGQHDKGHKNMTIWEFDSLRELWLKFLSQCAWMVSSTSLQCQGLRFVQSLWADPSHVILKGESGQQWSPVSCRSKHLQMNELEMAGSHRGQGRAGSRPSNIFKWIKIDGRVSHIKEGRVSQKGRASQKPGSHRTQGLTEGKVSQKARRVTHSRDSHKAWFHIWNKGLVSQNTRCHMLNWGLTLTEGRA